ncbi:hypothetical protein ABLN87_15495 [Ruegeria sp. SCPT10]|uniref:hypothetical protein n=1 Tax=Ruegeria sp. SCP10 TaxID=3141377 RepID=UPI003335D4D3
MLASIRRNQGFALIVVLSTLSIVALLFAITSNRFLAGQAYTEAELELGRFQQENQALAELAIGVFGPGSNQIDPQTSLVFQQNGRELTLILQDVGGLIDLNTAGPELLNALFKALEIPDAAVEQFREWRRKSYRLHSVADFARVADTPYEDGLRLREFATVHSGRFGIAPDWAPQGLMALLAGSKSSEGAQSLEIPRVWQTSASRVTFRVDLWEAGRFLRFVGVVHLGNPGVDGRILELY